MDLVLTRRLWPRTMVQPPLTEADRVSLTLQALQNRRRVEQRVEVTFVDREHADAPPTPDQISPPAQRTSAR